MILLSRRHAGTTMASSAYKRAKRKHENAAARTRQYETLMRQQQKARKQARTAGAGGGNLDCIDVTISDRTPLPIQGVSNLRMSKHSKSSVDWLAGLPKEWPLARGIRVANTRIAVRYRPTRFQHGTKPKKPSLFRDGIEMAGLSSENKWEPLWLVQPSQIVPNIEEIESNQNATGLGVFAGRAFAAGDIVTRWIGESAAVGSKKALAWQRETRKNWKQYYCITQRDVENPLVVVPACKQRKEIYTTALFFAAHLMNHSDEANCLVDAATLEVRAVRKICKNEELTIRYERNDSSE